jgi:nucleoside-diphosphate-sugar epimerase
MRILVTGGTGFIGSHTCVELLNAGYEVVIADNLYNSKAMVVDRIEQITGKRPAFYEVDVADREALTGMEAYVVTYRSAAVGAALGVDNRYSIHERGTAVSIAPPDAVKVKDALTG